MVCAPALRSSFTFLTKAAGDRGITDCRVKSWTAAGAEELREPRVSGDFKVMGAAVAEVALRSQTIAQGDNADSARVRLAPVAQSAAS